jgi:hypothetical protein
LYPTADEPDSTRADAGPTIKPTRGRTMGRGHPGSRRYDWCTRLR